MLSLSVAEKQANARMEEAEPRNNRSQRHSGLRRAICCRVLDADIFVRPRANSIPGIQTRTPKFVPLKASLTSMDPGTSGAPPAKKTLASTSQVCAFASARRHLPTLPPLSQHGDLQPQRLHPKPT